MSNADKNGWIPVSEPPVREPGWGEGVFVLAFGGMENPPAPFVALYVFDKSAWQREEEVWMRHADRDTWRVNPTHWQPLPEPPEEYTE